MHLWKFRSSIIEIQSEKYIVPKMSNTSTNILNGNEEIKIGHFREDRQGSSDNNKVNLKDEDITLSLRFEDGSTKQIEFTDISSSS